MRFGPRNNDIRKRMDCSEAPGGGVKNLHVPHLTIMLVVCSCKEVQTSSTDKITCYFCCAIYFLFFVKKRFHIFH